MSVAHRELAAGRWFTFSLVDQLANTGGEVERALNWRDKNADEPARRAVVRALELLDLTLADPGNRGRRRELARLRETLVDYFLGDNRYGSSPRLWRRYFLPFACAARRDR